MPFIFRSACEDVRTIMNLLDRLRGRTEEDVFAARLLKRIRQRGIRGVSYERETFSLVTSEDHIPLLSAFLEPPPLTPELLDSIIEALLSPEKDMSYEAVRDRLLPVVDNRMMAQMRERYSSAPRAARRPLADFLEIHLAIDRQLSARVVAEDDLQSWGVTFDEALEVGVANLLRKPSFPYKPMKDGFYVIGVEDYYASARILLPHIFEKLELEGGPVVVVISRNRVAVAGRNNHKALETLTQFVDDVISEEPKPIASWPIILENGGWTPLILRPDDCPALRHLIISHALMDYEAQTAWLQAISAREPDLTVAAFNVAQDGRSWAEWRRDETTLLPKTDALVLVDPPHAAVFRTWENVEKVLGPFEAEPDLHPPRYRVPAWSAEARDQLETEFELPPWLRKG
jgi:uncharacterized protein YtpQ (UPF0354 family)